MRFCRAGVTTDRMSSKPPLPDDLWAKIPPDAQAAILGLVQTFEHRIAALDALLNRNSSDSSKPPSTEPLHAKRQPLKPTSRKRRGGQLGHKRHTRELVPAEQLTGSVEIKPHACTGRGQALDVQDPEPFRHQVAELPEIRPEVIEYRLHRLTCPGCGSATRAKLPGDVPRGAFGPRLQAWAGLLRGHIARANARSSGSSPTFWASRSPPAWSPSSSVRSARSWPTRWPRSSRPSGMPGRSMSTRPVGVRPAGRPGSGSGRPPGPPPSGCIVREVMTPWKPCWARTPAAIRSSSRIGFPPTHGPRIGNFVGPIRVATCRR